MRKIIILALVLVTSLGWSQTKTTKNTKPAAKPAKATPAATNEWDDLDKTFVALVESLQKNDLAAFKAISLPGVDCIACVREHQRTGDYNFVLADVFFETVAPSFNVSPVYKAMVQRGYTFSTMTLEDYKPMTVPRDYPKDLKLYEVWVPTYLANELSKGHPGSSNGFQFIKTNGKFKFYGLVAIP